jgi:hypothetical protein
MNVFKDFEKKLEGLFEGVLLRAFRSGVQPVELGKKLVRELEGNKTISVSRIYVPNRYEVGLSPRDYSRFESYQAVLATELENLLITYIKEKGYVVLDRPRIKFVESERLREGEFWIGCRIEGELPDEQGVPAEGGILDRGRAAGPYILELMDGSGLSPFFPLDRQSIRMGRDGKNDIILPDPNVSRVHAGVTNRDEKFLITDLGSTNGTWVNEQRVSEQELKEHDVIRLGTTRLIFRRSSD